MRLSAFVLVFLLTTAMAPCHVVCAQSVDNKADQKQESPEPDVKSDLNAAVSQIQENLYWIFLTTGKSLEGVDTKDIREMQKEHLANFKRLAEAGKLLSAGPMSDPAKTLRGIVVAKAKDENSLLDLFKPDPYIQAGYMKIEATEMKVDYGVINTGVTPKGMEEYRIVVLEQSDEKTDEYNKRLTEQNQKFLEGLSSDETLRLAVSLDRNSYGRIMIMIMNKPESDELISEKLREMPAIKSGDWKTKIIPLYLGKGTLKNS